MGSPALIERPDPGKVRVVRDFVGISDLRRDASGNWSAQIEIDVELLLPDGRSVTLDRPRGRICGRQSGRRPYRHDWARNVEAIRKARNAP